MRFYSLHLTKFLFTDFIARYATKTIKLLNKLMTEAGRKADMRFAIQVVTNTDEKRYKISRYVYFFSSSVTLD